MVLVELRSVGFGWVFCWFNVEVERKRTRIIMCVDEIGI